MGLSFGENNSSLGSGLLFFPLVFFGMMTYCQTNMTIYKGLPIVLK